MDCSPNKKTDVDGTIISANKALSLPWRTGSQVGRTIYAVDPASGWERLVGILDTPELAAQVCDEHNRNFRG